MPTIGHYATLRNLLLEMERDLQITGLSDIDKRVISTLVLLDEGKYETVHLDDIRTHALTASIPWTEPAVLRLQVGPSGVGTVSVRGRLRSRPFRRSFKVA